ncbi:hypothetical protein ACTXT7_006028 [Hymenolepis weldensis]
MNCGVFYSPTHRTPTSDLLIICKVIISVCRHTLGTFISIYLWEKLGLFASRKASGWDIKDLPRCLDEIISPGLHREFISKH